MTKPKSQEEIDDLLCKDPRSLSYKDLPQEMQQAAADNLGDIVCGILNIPRERLKEVQHFDATELGNKTGIIFLFEPELTEEENKKFEAALEVVNKLAGGRPLIRPGKA
jgi:hypothetical protein